MPIAENQITQQSNDKLVPGPSVESLGSLTDSHGVVDTMLVNAPPISQINLDQSKANNIVPYIASECEQQNAYPENRFDGPEPLRSPAEPLIELKHRLKTIVGKAMYAKE